MQTQDLERLTGYRFQDQSLLRQALTHRSHSGLNNERLEFLGDGVLNFIVAHQLFQRFPKLSEGDLSRLRAQLVKESTLSEIARALALGEHLRLGEGELKSGGWRRPSLQADALEAVLGAIYLDGGFAAAEAVVVHLFASRLAQLDPKSIGKDPKSQLQEYLQGRHIELPEYRIIATEGEAHCQLFRVECHVAGLDISTRGEGTSRRAAEQQAAEAAYHQIRHEQ